MSLDQKNNPFHIFLATITRIEKQREFDRQVDRLKKSSAATTIWAIIPALFGIHGIAHFYLNRPIEGLILFFIGIFLTLFSVSFLPFPLFYWLAPYFSISSLLAVVGLSSESIVLLGAFSIIFRISLFIAAVVSARYHYSRYEFYIHVAAKRPWNNWGLDSKI